MAENFCQQDTIKTAYWDRLLDESDLHGADLGGANLGGANLRHADLRHADLRGANLAGADLTGALLTGANLTEAGLEDADLSNAYMDDATLPKANLSAGLPHVEPPISLSRPARGPFMSEVHMAEALFPRGEPQPGRACRGVGNAPGAQVGDRSSGPETSKNLWVSDLPWPERWFDWSACGSWVACRCSACPTRLLSLSLWPSTG